MRGFPCAADVVLSGKGFLGWLDVAVYNWTEPSTVHLPKLRLIALLLGRKDTPLSPLAGQGTKVAGTEKTGPGLRRWSKRLLVRYLCLSFHTSIFSATLPLLNVFCGQLHHLIWFVINQMLIFRLLRIRSYSNSLQPKMN